MPGMVDGTLTAFGPGAATGLEDDNVPVTTVLADGNYVVPEYENNIIYLSVYDELGDRLNGPIPVFNISNPTGGTPNMPAGYGDEGGLRIAALSTGGFVALTNDSSSGDGDPNDFVAHVFSYNGTLESTFALSTPGLGTGNATGSNDYYASVVGLANGGFEVTYTDNNNTNSQEQFSTTAPPPSTAQDTNSRDQDIYVQAYTPNGDGSFSVSTTTNGSTPNGQVYQPGFFSDGYDQTTTRDSGHNLAVLSSGDTVTTFNDNVAYAFYGQGYFDQWNSTDAISAQVTDANGNPVGGKILVVEDINNGDSEHPQGVENTGAPWYREGGVGNATVAAAGSGFAVLWDERDFGGGPGGLTGDYYQDVHLTLFNASGTATTSDIALGLEQNYTDGNGAAQVASAYYAEATPLADGSGIAVAYTVSGENGAPNQLYLTTYDLSGHQTNAPIDVGSLAYSGGGSSNVQQPYDITTLPDGTVAVTYESVNDQNSGYGGPTLTKLFVLAGPANLDPTVQNGDNNGDTVTLLGGTQYYYGGTGNDTITAGPGVNTIDGGAGNDTILVGLGTMDTVSGGGGDDTLSFANAAAGITFDLAYDGIAQSTGGAGTVLASGFDHVVGSPFNDIIYGDSGNDTLDGGAGNDILVAGSGTNVLIGGAGADTLIGGSGDNEFLYNATSDSTLAAYDVIENFHYGDTINLTAVATSAVDIVKDGADTFVYFSPNGNGTYAGVVEVQGGDFAQGDVIAPGATFVQNETLSPFGLSNPAPAPYGSGFDAKGSTAALTNGEFVSVLNTTNGNYNLQLYSSLGDPVGQPIVMTDYNPNGGGGQSDARVASLTGGGFVVATQDSSVNANNQGDIVAHVYSASGQLEAVLPVDTSFIGTGNANEGRLSVAGTANGGFQVIWYDFGPDGNNTNTTTGPDGGTQTFTNSQGVDAYVQAFSQTSGGSWAATTSSNVQVNAPGYFTDGYDQIQYGLQAQSMTALSNGDTVITYNDQAITPNATYNNYSNTDSISAQILGPDGQPVTAKIDVIDQNQVNGNYIENPSVTATADGFAVTWDERDFDPSYYYNGLHIRFFDTNGNALTTAIEVAQVNGTDANGNPETASGDHLIATPLADGSGLALVYEQDAKFEGHQQLYIETVDLHGHVISGPLEITDAVYGSGEYSATTLASGAVEVTYEANVNGSETQETAEYLLTGGSSTTVLNTGTTGMDITTVPAGTSYAGDGGGDVIAATGNDQIMAGGGGAYVFASEAGGDSLSGGPGDNTISFQNVSGSITVDLADEGQPQSIGVGAPVTLSGFDILVGNNAGDTLIGAFDTKYIYGGTGNDVIEGGPGAQVLYGDGGDNTFVYTGTGDSNFNAYDTIGDFHTGADKIDLSALGAVTIELDHFGSSTFVYFSPDSSGNFQGVVDVTGQVEGGDLIANSAATVIQVADANNDTLIGGTQSGYLYSGPSGTDTLIAGPGQQTMVGEGSVNTFQFNNVAYSPASNPDYIVNFNPGAGDIIDLSHLDAIPSTPAQDHFTLVNAFDGHAGELVVTSPDSNNDFYIEGDTTGSGAASFEIIVHLTGAMDVSHIHL